ncbi:MAG: molybdopterin-dependent oxidoreductase [Planctomycetota bacterium]|nr:molybdopterin-dependent oxidoreductase [Planctomycetota bacterium]
MPTVIVNGREIEIGADERLNCIQAAQRADVEIPHYCWHKDLSVVASCRMCLVEVGERKPDGTIAMVPKLVPGCQTPVKAETVIVSNSPAVLAAQKATLEYLLLNHPLDCPVCDQAGECFLQDYSYKYGRGYSRLQEPKLLKPDKDHIGDQITLFTDRCVMCTRCVRFTREISGTGELQVIERGSHAEIDIFPGEPCNNKLAGNVVDICPVGALCSKDFLYEQRVWWLESTSSVCPNCSTGCSIRVDQNKDVVYRFKPRHNPLAQGEFMCDEGRFGYKYINSPDRLTQPLVRLEGDQQPTDWETILPGGRAAIEGAITAKPQAVAAVLSPWMTVEEAYLLAVYLKNLSKEIRLYLGPVRVVGDDDCYPKDVHGNAVAPTRFTIRAEKCPNRQGVEAIIRHFQGSTLSMDDFWKAVSAGQIDAAYLVGGDPHEPWLTDEQGALLDTLKLTIVQDILPSAASRRAHYVLPGGSFAERDGTFVNHAGLAQPIKRAIHSPEEARPDNRILWELAGRRGLFNAGRLRNEIAEHISALQALTHPLGEFGVMLDTPGKPTNASVVANAATSP